MQTAGQDSEPRAFLKTLVLFLCLSSRQMLITQIDADDKDNNGSRTSFNDINRSKGKRKREVFCSDHVRPLLVHWVVEIMSIYTHRPLY